MKTPKVAAFKISVQTADNHPKNSTRPTADDCAKDSDFIPDVRCKSSILNLFWNFEYTLPAACQNQLGKCCRQGLRAVLVVGQMFFLCTMSFISSDNNSPRKKLEAFKLIITVLVASLAFVDWILQAGHDIANFRRDLEPIDKLIGIWPTIFRLTVVLIYLHMILSRSKLKSLSSQMVASDRVKKSETCKLALSFSKKVHPVVHNIIALENWSLCFHRKSIFWILVYAMAGMAKTLYDICKYFPAAQTPSRVIQLIYNATLPQWKSILSENDSYLVICLTLFRSYVQTAAIAIEVVGVVICLAVVEHVKTFHGKVSRTKLRFIEVMHNDESECKLDGNDLEELYEDYLALKCLIKDTSVFVSPLIDFGYIYNVFIIFLNVFLWIHPLAGPLGSLFVERFFMTTYYLCRVGIITYYAAEINQWLKNVAHVLEGYPTRIYSKQIERMDRGISKDTLGIYVCGTILITRMFFMSLMSFMFTGIIVLLQSGKCHLN